MMLIDSHAHIQLKNFDNDREAMLARAQKAGVKHIDVVGEFRITSNGLLFWLTDLWLTDF